MGRTYYMSVTLETSHPPMSWSNNEASENIELYATHPTATQTHSRDIQETFKRHSRDKVARQHRSVSGESATPQSGSRRDVRRRAGEGRKGQEGAARGKYGRDGHT